MIHNLTPYEEGSDDSNIVFVGEAPSYMEFKEGKPFCGPAGNLFDRCLHSARITRATCKILNVFEVMVKKDEKGGEQKIISSDGQYLLWTNKRGFTEAGIEFSKGCRERLSRCKANVIAPLGAPAFNLCLGEQKPRPMTKWRGSILKGVDGRKVVGSIHPSASLRGTYEWRYLIISDLERVKEESTHSEIHLPQRRLIIDPTFKEAITFLKRMLDSPAVDTDIETLGGQVDCFSLSADPSEAISINLVNEHFQPKYSESEELEIITLYAQIISNPRIIKINQNICFDLAVLLDNNNIVPLGQCDDPMVAHSIMYPFLAANLGTICSLYTREPYYKDDGILQDSPTIDDFEKRWVYSCKDSAISLESWQVLNPALDEKGYRQTYNITIPMLSSLIYMMVGGIRVDEYALGKTRDVEKGELAEVVEKLHQIMGRPILTSAPKRASEKRAAAASNAINVNSNQQVKKYFYEEKGLPPYKNKEGGITVDDTALTRIFRRHNLEEARFLQIYRQLAKDIATYLEMKFTNGRVKCSYNIRGAWTGRLSSSQTTTDEGGNFQNMPVHFRGFLKSDLAEIENAESME